MGGRKTCLHKIIQLFKVFHKCEILFSQLVKVEKQDGMYPFLKFLSVASYKRSKRKLKGGRLMLHYTVHVFSPESICDTSVLKLLLRFLLF